MSSRSTQTEDVVAVVNQIQVNDRSVWDFRPAKRELKEMGRNTVQSLPVFGLALMSLALTAVAAGGISHLTRGLLKRRMSNTLLRQIAARTVMIPVWIIGFYLVLRISGLTQIALTVLGGTGLFGLIVGIAFQNIAENFLASILISIQRPFEAGDFVEVAGFDGFVQRVTTRGTVLLTLDGNHVQVPNAIIYKSVIRNLSANPNSRLNFRLGLDYGQDIQPAQAATREILKQHPAVLQDPEPSVLVEELADSRVYLRVYFWVNIKNNSSQKVRSSIMQLVQQAVQGVKPKSSAAISPDDHDASRHQLSTPAPKASQASAVTKAAGNFASEKGEIERQARESRQVEAGPDLLGNNSATNGRVQAV